MNIRYFIFVFVFSSSIWGQKISRKSIARQLKKIEVFQQAHIGISISELDDNKVVADYQGAHYMTPASNTKLLTFLGASQQFEKLPALAFVQERDSILHFKSTGYPLLFHPFYRDSILDSFFDQKKSWNYYATLNPPKPFGSGWAWDDYSYYFAAESSSFPIFGNTVYAQSLENNLKTVPKLFEAIAVLDTTAKPFVRDRDRNTFLYNPNAWKVDDSLYRPFVTSDRLFVNILENQINQKVELHSDTTLPLEWNFLFTEQEEVLYKGLLQDSDNGLAEALLLMISQQNFNEMAPEKAIALLLDQWKTWLPDPIEWVDGSGISRYNMVTPRTLVRVLQKIQQTVGWQTIQTYFPKGATSGTLKKYSNSALYAKTGTLRHTHNLSGYWVHPKGKIYVFSIMVNHHTTTTDEVRAGIGSLLEWFEKKLR